MALGFNLSALPPLREYELERSFDEREALGWMRDNWWKSFFFSAAYVMLIFGTQHFMKERRGYKLRAPLTLWSLGLALFSAIGSHRTWKHMASITSSMGFKQSVCDQSFYVHHVSKLWAYLFALSKVLELGDTVFIVLRKQKLIFLHWYHHIATLIYAWYAYKEMVPGGGWFTVMNFSVHTFMYSYYSVRAAGFRVPRYIAMTITISQILQMLIAIIVNVLLVFWMEDKVCPVTWSNISISFLMYFSYLVLFCNFFFKAYLTGTQKSKGE
uniref:Elongation of very long chain fatty acids protein n=1 Tax=Cairina moschata TaxID=8855 RepID=A0A8C3CVT4_CAIMO